MSETKPVYVQKNNTGVLFKNQYKTTPNHPDYTGNATIEDNKYKVAAWTKVSAKGAKFLSLSYTNEDDLHPLGVGKPKEPDNRTTDDILDDKINF
jgi:hypothetical protein